MISRPLRSLFRQRLASTASGDQGSWVPWSLLLTSPAEADQTEFWFVFYIERDLWLPEIHVANVHPPERFDLPSKQLRTTPIPQKYYNLNRFRIIDGIIDLSLVLTRPERRTYSCAKLLVGRQASNRRQTPEPWCEFAENLAPDIFREGRSAADSIRRYEADFPAPNGPKRASYEGYSGRVMRASVREKEISGVMHYLVVVELANLLTPKDERIIILQKEDPHDRMLEAIEDKGVQEPLRL